MGNIRRILRKNTAGSRVIATKLIFTLRNKQQPHHTKKNGATELCVKKGV